MKKLLIVILIIIAIPLTTKAAIAPWRVAVSNPYALQNGLVGWWTFDGNKMANGVAEDSSGSGNNGNLINIATSTFYVPGHIGQGVNFDGVNDYIATGFKIASQSSGTVSWWQKPNRTFNSGVIEVMWDQEQSASPQLPEFGCQHFSDNNFYCGFDATADEDRVIVAASASNWVQNQWQMYTLTWVSGGDTILYRNGIQIGIKSGGTTPNSPAEVLNIGATPDYVGLTAFNGSEDDFRIYNRTLSVTEIQQLYNLGLAKINTSPISSVINSGGLVGYWTFDGKDMVNGVAHDVSGNSNNGNFFNISTTTLYTPGKIGQSVNLDGSNDCVQVANQANFNFGRDNAYSVSFWMKINSVAPIAEELVEKNVDGGSYVGWSVQLYGAGLSAFSDTLNIGIVNDVTTNDYLLLYGPAHEISINTWYHVVSTYTGGNTVASWKLYVNGVSQTLTNPSGTALTGTGLTTQPVTLGCRYAFGPSGLPINPMNGIIDDVRIYNRALSQNEAAQIYNQGAVLIKK